MIVINKQQPQERRKRGRHRTSGGTETRKAMRDNGSFNGDNDTSRKTGGISRNASLINNTFVMSNLFVQT